MSEEDHRAGAVRDGLAERFLNGPAAPFLAAAENAQLGMSISVIDGAAIERVYLNEAAGRLLGYVPAELVGTSTFLIFAPEEAERMQMLLERWRSGEPVPRYLETVVLRKDGSRLPVEIAYTHVAIEGKLATIAFLRDISERRRTERALKESEEHFRKLIEAAPEAVMVTRKGRIAYANPCCLRLLGYQHAEDIREKDVGDLVHADDRQKLEERRTRILGSTVPPPPSEYRFVRRDGPVVTAECSSLSIEYEGAPAILTFMRDITERKETQALLIQTDRMATIGTLAAGVAHELNNPLAYVMLNLGILERELDDLIPGSAERERVKTRLRTLQEGAERMATIVRDLRSFCRPNAPALGPVDLRLVLESAINMAMNELKDRARLVRDYAPVPLVFADGARLGQVFLNLLLNAAQAMPEGDPDDNQVRVAIRADDARRVEVAIEDTGQGIPADVIGRIFEPFFTTKPVGVGTGLGLSICQSILASMNAQIAVESRVGRGSTFRVTLPLPDVSFEAKVEEPVPTPRPIEGAIRLLIIDDEIALANALKRVLDADYQTIAMTSGRRALDLLLDGATFDVIVCDVLMPGLSGIDLYRELKGSRPEMADRVIFMSGASSLPRVADFFEELPNGKIDKPIDLPRLKEMIHQVARKARA